MSTSMDSVKCGIVALDSAIRRAMSCWMREGSCVVTSPLAVPVSAGAPALGASASASAGALRLGGASGSAVPACACGWAAPPDAAASTSALTIRPPGPVPSSAERSMPCSRAMRRATGDAFGSPAVTVGRGGVGLRRRPLAVALPACSLRPACSFRRRPSARHRRCAPSGGLLAVVGLGLRLVLLLRRGLAVARPRRRGGVLVALGVVAAGPPGPASSPSGSPASASVRSAVAAAAPAPSPEPPSPSPAAACCSPSSEDPALAARLGRRALADSRDHLADREGRALLGHDLQRPLVVGLVGHRGLVGLDLDELVALGHLVAGRLEPLEDRALLHGVGQPRHDDVGHGVAMLHARRERRVPAWSAACRRLMPRRARARRPASRSNGSPAVSDRWIS